jgi:putative peptidoglycan lipid II flippase
VTRDSNPLDEEAALLSIDVGDAAVPFAGVRLPGPGELVRRRSSIRRLAAALMSGALVSKALGFIREMLMAQVLGASMAADGFRGAITAVMLPLVFLQNESVPAIMVPMHRDSQAHGDAPRQLAALTIAVTLVAAILTLATEMLGSWWVNAVVGGFPAQTQTLTLQFVRIMALAMPASAMLNCLAAGEIAIGRSRVTNIRASLLNLSVLVGIGLIVVTGSLDAVAWAFALAFNLLAGLALCWLWQEGHLSFAGITPLTVLAAGLEFARRLRPLIGLPTAEQGHVWIERVLASRLITGSLASLDYARTLTDSALLLISQPVGLAVLSTGSRHSESVQVEAIARPILALMLPASVFIFVFAPDLVELIFHRGAFDETGVQLTSGALRGISVGLWAGTLGWILLRILNNTRRNAAVAVILVAAYAVNVAVNLTTTGLQETSQAGILILGLGEAARGCTVLAGAILALRCGVRLLSLVAVACIPAMMLAMVDWRITENITGHYERLFAGGAACAICICLAASMLMPTRLQAVLEQIRSRASRFRKAQDAS